MSKYVIHLILVMMAIVVISGPVYGFNALNDPALIGWWTCDEGQGTVVADSSVNGNDGAFVNGDPVWIEGVHGSAVELTIPTLIEIPAMGLTLTEATMAAWVMPYGTQPDWSAVIMHRESGIHGFNFMADYQLAYHWNDDSALWDYRSGAYLVDNEWTFAALTIRPNTATFYINGVEAAVNSVSHAEATWDGNVYLGGDGTDGQSGRRMTGALDEVSFFSRALGADEVEAIMQGLIDSALASTPAPEDESADVSRDVVLAWAAGDAAVSHDVYLGTNLDDVMAASPSNPLGVLLSQGQSALACDAGRLDFGQTYYWRVDETDSAGNTMEGLIWSFEVEPLAYEVTNIVVSSNTTPVMGAVPEHTIDGSGLNDDNQHSTNSDAMWVGVADGNEAPYIQYEFDRVYKLHEMAVWNYNVIFETMLGFGLKDVTIEYSIDGMEWAALGDFELAQATATADYTANTVVDFGGVGAKYVKITTNTSYGNQASVGLSEVRFLYIAVQPREPQPADGATDVNPNGLLSWRAGREAASHELSLNADETAVADGTARIDSVADSTYALDALGLDLDTTYYWKVDEVNDAEAVTVWEGDVWSFSTQAYFVIDDFESYSDDAGSRIYEIWLDGWVNETGSTVGYLEEPFAEQTIVNSGSQAMPLFYDNGSASVSETTLEFSVAQNWTGNNVQTLAVHFHGAEDNSGQLYLKINNTKVAYDGDAIDLTKGQWQSWLVDLTAVGANLQNVTELTIGIEGSGAEGVVYVDDIRLYAKAIEYATPVDPDPAGLVLYYALDEGTGTTAADDSGNGNDGTLEGGPTWIDGVAGGALSFDGVDDYVTTGTSLLNDLQAFSIACWIKGDLSSADRTGLVGQNDCIEYGISASNNIQIWSSGSGAVDLTWSYDADTDWHHIVAVGDGTSVTLYLDGKIAVSGGAAITDTYGSSTYSLNIAGGGVFDTADNWFAGQIDEIYVYQRALSAGEVAGLAGRMEPVVVPF